MRRVLLSFVLLINGVLGAQTKELVPPLEVQKAFEKEFPKVKPMWSKVYRGEEKTELNYDADFTLNDINMTAVYNSVGVFKTLEATITLQEVPAKAINYLKRNYPNNKITEVLKVMTNTNKITYEVGMEIEGKLSDAVFDKQGDLLEIVPKSK